MSSTRLTADEVERLGEEIAELAAHLHIATYRLLVRLRDFDECEGWNVGFQSCAHWLSWRAGIAPGAAREKLRVARALADLPLLGRAMECGELSYSKVRALTRIATPANEEELLELARQATAAQVETIVRAWRRVDRLAEAEAERERHEARYLTVRIDDDGSYVVRGRLDPEVGALLDRALDAAARALHDEQGSRTSAHGNAVAAGREPRSGEAVAPGLDPGNGAAVVPGLEAPTASQRRADALGLLVELALGSRELARAAAATKPLGRAARVQIVLHVDAEALMTDSDSGQSVLAGGVRVPAGTSRRLACDASRVVMTHDTQGRVLDVGRRTRTVPPAIRRALEHRDRGCRFPGCGNRFTDAHHVRHWADGGATRLDNLLLLCRRHHRAVHEEGFRVRATASGAFVFRRPDGRPLPDVPPLPLPLRQNGETGMSESLRSLVSDTQSRTAAPDAPYERLDLDWAMRVLYRPGG